MIPLDVIDRALVPMSAGFLDFTPLKVLPHFLRVPYNVCPNYLPTFSNGTLSDKELETVENCIKEIGKKLALTESELPTLHIETGNEGFAYLNGFTYSIGGPSLTISTGFFPFLGQNEEERNWIAFVNQLPDNPLELAKTLQDLPDDLKNRVKAYARKYFERMHESELPHIIAHELTHAKAGHNLSSIGCVGGAYLVAQSAFFALFGSYPALLGVSALPFMLHAHLTTKKNHEEEANAAGARLAKKGAILFHKRALLLHFAGSEAKNYVLETIERLKSADHFHHYPNSAKRLAQAITEEEKDSLQGRASYLHIALGALGVAYTVGSLAEYLSPLFFSNKQ